MLNLEKNFPLIRALNALIHAKGNGNTLFALRELQHILATQASESDRFDAYISAKEEVRGMVLDLTEDLQDAHPELMPPQVLGYINELPEIRAICPYLHVPAWQQLPSGGHPPTAPEYLTVQHTRQCPYGGSYGTWLSGQPS